jgi:hypothetical protein
VGLRGGRGKGELQQFECEMTGRRLLVIRRWSSAKPFTPTYLINRPRRSVFHASGVKTPEKNTNFMSCLKARPTKFKSFSTACEVEDPGPAGAAIHKAYL